MSRLPPIVGTAIFFVLAPGGVGIYLPWLFTHWHIGPPLLGIPAIRLLGALLIAAALPVVLDSFARFAIQGLGTPAPVYPTKHLVVSGLYRYVRNPMYLAVSSLVFGQALFFGSIQVIEYGLAAAVAFTLFVRLYEEPTLRHTFGTEYDEFCVHVPRWIPRLRPWPGPGSR